MRAHQLNHIIISRDPAVAIREVRLLCFRRCRCRCCRAGAAFSRPDRDTNCVCTLAHRDPLLISAHRGWSKPTRASEFGSINPTLCINDNIICSVCVCARRAPRSCAVYVLYSQTHTRVYAWAVCVCVWTFQCHQLHEFCIRCELASGGAFEQVYVCLESYMFEQRTRFSYPIVIRLIQNIL